MSRRLIATLVTSAALPLCLCAPAHALGVNIQAPGTSVTVGPDGNVSVTAPGTQVNAGPGGASVTVDPNKALGSLPGGSAPSTPPAPAQPQGGSPTGSSGTAPDSSPSPSPERSPAAAPAAGTKPRAPARSGTRGGARSSSTGLSGAAGDTTAGEGSAATKAGADRAGGRTARTQTPAAAPAKASTVERIVDRIPAELLAALALVSLLAAAMSLVWLRERSKVRAARRQAKVDPLTGIPNRLAFQERLAQEWKRARRYLRPLGVLMLDLDGLKQVNDSKGHDAGDGMIRAAAELIVNDIRESDHAARLAGDEFVVLCPESQSDGLQQLAAKLEQRLKFAGIDASIGWAELTESDVRPEDMVARADASMYREKETRSAARRELISARGLAIAG